MSFIIYTLIFFGHDFFLFIDSEIFTLLLPACFFLFIHTLCLCDGNVWRVNIYKSRKVNNNTHYYSMPTLLVHCAARVPFTTPTNYLSFTWIDFVHVISFSLFKTVFHGLHENFIMIILFVT